MNGESDNTSTNGCSTRRDFVGMGLGLAAALVLARTGAAQEGKGRPGDTPAKAPEPVGRRKLGKLEVSAVGLGVQNMSRRYETTVPHWPQMMNIIRAAVDLGITFFDTAEIYGPFTNEEEM